MVGWMAGWRPLPPVIGTVPCTLQAPMEGDGEAASAQGGVRPAGQIPGEGGAVGAVPLVTYHRRARKASFIPGCSETC